MSEISGSQGESERFKPTQESLEKMKQMREVLPSLQEQFPYVSGLGFYGSRTKGLEGPNSDADVIMFFNREKLTDPTDEDYGFRDVRYALSDAAGITIDEKDFAVDISESGTLNDIKTFIKNVDYDVADPKLAPDQINLRLIKTPTTRKLFGRFFLATGSDIYQNRQYVLERFKEIPNGDVYFHRLMQCMAEFESDTRKDAEIARYPTTIAEAEKYFRTNTPTYSDN
jgi:hypothetical protein